MLENVLIHVYACLGVLCMSLEGLGGKMCMRGLSSPILEELRFGCRSHVRQPNLPGEAVLAAEPCPRKFGLLKNTSGGQYATLSCGLAVIEANRI